MNYTEYYSLQKDLANEKYNVNVINMNSDIIDSALHKLDLKDQSQDEMLATKEALNNEIARATAKENEIAEAMKDNEDMLSNLNELVDNIPTKLSQLENDNGFITKRDDILSTSNEVKENTATGKLVDALIIKEVFHSVSDGKELLASAITDRGIKTDATDTFATMSNNIQKISSEGVNDNYPINSPYLFAINWSPVFPSSDSFILSVPFPVTQVKKAVIKKLLLAFRKYSTSNTASWYFRILGIKKGTTDEVVISEYSHTIFISTSNTNYTVNTNIDQDTEIDLSEYDQITGFQLGKNNISGTIIQFKVYLQFELELYF